MTDDEGPGGFHSACVAKATAHFWAFTPNNRANNEADLERWSPGYSSSTEKRVHTLDHLIDILVDVVEVEMLSTLDHHELLRLSDLGEKPMQTPKPYMRSLATQSKLRKTEMPSVSTVITLSVFS